MRRASRSTLLVAVLLAATACIGPFAPPAKLVGPKSPNDWQGTEDIDPANDLTKLHGRWHRVVDADSHMRVEQALIIDDHKATFDNITLRQRNEKPDVDSHIFVINSVLTPKVIRFLSQEGKVNNKVHPWSLWYELDNNTLTIWDKWAEFGEMTKDTYHRSDTTP